MQLTLTGSPAGFAIGQLVIGPLSDALGRRPPLLIGLAVFALASVGCALAPTVEVLIALRVLQGVGVAGASVVALALALAVVTDLFDGAGAARLVLVLGVAPVFAPSIGSFVLAVTAGAGCWCSWR